MANLKKYIRKTVFYRPLAILWCYLKNARLILASFIFRFLKVQNNKIVFASMVEKTFSLQPKMIYEELLNRIPEGLDIVWLLPDDVNCPDGVRKVRRKSIRSIYELSTAKVWVDNARKDFWIRKKKNQFYVQTWHGPVYIKGIENDCKKALSPNYIAGAKQDSKNADYIVSETEWSTDRLPSTFWYDGAIIEGEFKRPAYFNSEESCRKVRSFYNIKDGEEIVLYVPTFRRDGNTDCYSLQFESVLKELKAKYGKDYKFIVRLHPNIAEKQDFLEYSERVLNGSVYPSVDELTIASDIIISDYSSCIFEGFRTQKKVFLFATDIEEYANDDRGLNFDLFNLPAPMAQNNDEMINNIINFDAQTYKKKSDEFTKRLGYYEADAAVIVVDHIQNYLLSQKK